MSRLRVRIQAVFAAVGLGLGAAQALAIPVGLAQVTDALQGPVFIQYTNNEQFSLTNQIDCTFGGPACKEGNWGVAQLTSIVKGTAQIPLGSDIQGGGAGIFADPFHPNAGFITGMFYGVQVDTTNPTRATGGSSIYIGTTVLTVPARTLQTPAPS